MSLMRSLLFVPATTPDRIPKALASGADAVIVDLEDAVSVDRKAEAREEVVRFLGGSVVGRKPPLFVRVNGPKTPWWDADVEAVVLPGITGVVLPKTEDPADVSALDERTSRLAAGRGCEPPGLIPVVESALGLVRAYEIASASSSCRALALGGEDFTRDIGAVRTPGGEELSLARMQVVVAARAAGILPVDTVFIDFRDDEALAREAESARKLGFAGKLIIHPRQVETVNRAFSPDPEEVEAARAVLSAFDAAEAKGDAVANMDGRMLDPAVVEQARRIVDMAVEISQLEECS